MSEVNGAGAPIKVIVFSETSNARYFEEELREAGYDPIFCTPDKRECVRARKSMRSLVAKEIRIFGSIISQRLLGLIAEAEENLGFTPIHM